MTDTQRIELRQSEVRTRLSELATIEAPSADESTELDRLTTEFRALEGRHRAATIAGTAPAAREPEKEPETRAETDTTGEGAEFRALAGRAEVRAYMAAAVAGIAPTGAEAELQAAVKVESRAGGVPIPWEALEVRADTATDTSALDGAVAQRPILRRLFGRSIMGALGVRIDSVPVGQSEYVIFATGASPAQTAEGTAKDAEAATFTTQTLKPKRLTGRYQWTVEQSAQIGAGLESAFRRDLRDAVQAEMSDGILNGDGTAPNVTGFLARITAPSNPTAVADTGKYTSFLVSGIDGIHAETEAEISVILGTKTYAHAATVYQAAIRRDSNRDYETPGPERDGH